jgi:VIT1/CCC1 family predicted Fe2+/Mn2+ transporter
MSAYPISASENMPKQTGKFDAGPYLRDGIFGIADSLVSTVGLLSGINVGGTARPTIIITGVVYAFVEGFSMAVGSFLSEKSAEEFEAKGEVRDGRAVVGGAVMLAAFILASFIPIVPYFFFSLSGALWVSIVLSILALFCLGLVLARISKVSLFGHAMRMALLGGVAILIGVIVGKFMRVP